MHSVGDNSSDTQERLYKMLEKLQTLARDIPPKFQQRLPYDLLSSLAHVLLNNTVFEIVQELAELQHMTEKSLHQQRSQMINKHKEIDIAQAYHQVMLDPSSKQYTAFPTHQGLMQYKLCPSVW
nr:protein DGCR6-like isoform X1 [Cherax quadricarinatus]